MEVTVVAGENPDWQLIGSLGQLFSCGRDEHDKLRPMLVV